MAKLARCPSCGAPVEFKSVVSVLAVCDYCQSTLLRRGEELENLGKMAALIEDRSPLQRGAEGRWQGVHFGLIGRIQLQYEQGLWNEWHLLFDDGMSGWLSEAGGEYVLSRPQALSAALPAALPAFDALSPGQTLQIAGRRYSVTNKLTATCVAGEGELPFKVGAGYTAPVVDLRDEQGGEGGFATLDYSDDPEKPLLFVGTSVDFKSLNWANLREPTQLPQPTFQVRAFNCPNCGAPRQVTHEHIVMLGCVSCGALLDTGTAEIKLIQRVAGQVKLPRLSLGSKGNLRGTAVEIIGFMRRCMKADGIEYCWGEYVCLGPDNALLWLTEYDGHWNLARTLTRSVAASADKAMLGKQEFKHFQNYRARVDVVLGEFPWRVQANERAMLSDYVAPPLLLSRETTDNEVSWTLAEYVEPAEIAAAFALKLPLPSPRGVYANQPNPYEATHARVCRNFWRLAGVALLITVLLMAFAPGGNYLDEPVNYGAADDEPQLVRQIDLPAGARRLRVQHETDLNNHWAGFNITLANQDTGEAWQAYRELSYWSGVDGGESWSEGGRDDEVIFVDLPPGRYTVVDEAELEPNGRPVRAQVRVGEPGPRGSSFILLLLLLILFPIFTRVRKGSFEVSRWAESDHPIVTSGDDD